MSNEVGIDKNDPDYCNKVTRLAAKVSLWFSAILSAIVGLISFYSGHINNFTAFVSLILVIFIGTAIASFFVLMMSIIASDMDDLARKVWLKECEERRKRGEKTTSEDIIKFVVPITKKIL